MLSWENEKNSPVKLRSDKRTIGSFHFIGQREGSVNWKRIAQKNAAACCFQKSGKVEKSFPDPQRKKLDLPKG
jgi:hypothetical protein